MVVDYIIVGQGLAGSAVAIQLLKLKRKFVMFDDPEGNASSRVAAGLFNPVTGKKMVKTWLADTIFPYLHRYYNNLQEQTKSRFFFPTPLYRPFVSVEEQNEWMGKSTEPAYAPYVDHVFASNQFEKLRDDYGGILLKHSGYLDTEAYIDSVAGLIREHAILIPEILETEKVVIGRHSIRYGDIQAKKIIVCSGVQGNSWFNWVPIHALKGETITIRNNFLSEIVVNRGVYMVPGKTVGEWRVGSTYNFQDRVPGITFGGRKELERKLNALMTDPYVVTDHQWGFRPTTPDRRPIIGSHPEHKTLAIFNGMGTKGVSLAPYFSEVLVHWLEKWGTLHKEVDIERFKSLYWGSPE